MSTSNSNQLRQRRQRVIHRRRETVTWVRSRAIELQDRYNAHSLTSTVNASRPSTVDLVIADGQSYIYVCWNRPYEIAGC